MITTVGDPPFLKLEKFTLFLDSCDMKLVMCASYAWCISESLFITISYFI